MTATVHPAEVLDSYLNVCSSEEFFVEQFLSLTRFLGVEGPVLDCAVGTGFGTIPLLKRGVKIVCSDGSDAMLKKFDDYASRERVAVKPLQVKWADLGRCFPEIFDLVMCRGNSLAYADSWDQEVSRADNQSILGHLEGMYASVRPGGYLFVDIPNYDGQAPDESLIALRHSGRSQSGDLILIDEEISTHPSKSLRRWSVNMSIGGYAHRFDRYSALFNAEDFVGSLKYVGFTDVSEFRGSGLRSHYSGYIARK
ncbi:class I SAM-dependent methyltransferase [Mycobacterium sp. BMJ-28]